MAQTAISAFCAAVSFALFSAPAHAADASVHPGAFGSVLLSANSTPYDGRWSRVQSRTLGFGSKIVAAARDLRGLQRLRFVNSAVNRAVKYADDSSNWGESDYWASAAQTFGRGAGDCEDYAIAKMQVLRAAGIAASDLYFVVGNDLAARSAHAVLIVRLEERFWVLDNFHDEVRPDSAYREFRPVMTLSNRGKWLHGYRATRPSTFASGTSNRVPAPLMNGSSLAAVVAAQTGSAAKMR